LNQISEQLLAVNALLLGYQFLLAYKYRVGQKVRCCIAGCNFVNYGPIFRKPLLESLLNFQKVACNFAALKINA